MPRSTGWRDSNTSPARSSRASTIHPSTTRRSAWRPKRATRWRAGWRGKRGCLSGPRRAPPSTRRSRSHRGFGPESSSPSPPTAAIGTSVLRCGAPPSDSERRPWMSRRSACVLLFPVVFHYNVLTGVMVVTLRVRREQLERIIAQARAEAPNECCGMLAGHGEVVEEVFPGRNKDQSPRTYLMDPQDQLHALRAIDEHGWALVGIYHSHPHTEAYPSRTDRERALDMDGNPLFPETQYVIVSLRDAQPQVRAFRITERQVTEEEVVIA